MWEEPLTRSDGLLLFSSRQGVRQIFQYIRYSLLFYYYSTGILLKKSNKYFNILGKFRAVNFSGRKKSPLDPSCCPVCGITLRASDLESHFVQELERLERVSRSFRTQQRNSVSPCSGSSSSALPAATSTTHVQKREQDTRWEVNT